MVGNGNTGKVSAPDRSTTCAVYLIQYLQEFSKSRHVSTMNKERIETLIIISLLFLLTGCKGIPNLTPVFPMDAMRQTSTVKSPVTTSTAEPHSSETTPPSQKSLETQPLSMDTPMSEALPHASPTLTLIPYEVIRDVPYIPGGDADQVLNIYLPDEEIRNPVTLLVLGGPNIPFLRHFARLGYVGVEVHYSEGPTQRGIQNSLCSLAWAYANADTYGFDPQQIVVVGTSLYGGQAALLGIINDPIPYLEDCPIPWPEGNKPLGVITIAGGLDQVNLDEIDGSDPAFLLVHGLSDVTIEPQQSENFGRALQLAGVEVELVLLQHVSHNSVLNNPDTIKAMDDFLIRLAE